MRQLKEGMIDMIRKNIDKPLTRRAMRCHKLFTYLICWQIPGETRNERRPRKNRMAGCEL
jgi:hypothetical protein